MQNFGDLLRYRIIFDIVVQFCSERVQHHEVVSKLRKLGLQSAQFGALITQFLGRGLLVGIELFVFFGEGCF
jgi:RNA-binding protein YlmH